MHNYTVSWSTVRLGKTLTRFGNVPHGKDNKGHMASLIFCKRLLDNQWQMLRPNRHKHLGSLAVLPLLFCLGCNARQPVKPSSQQATITYASNPERFVQKPVYRPPFSIMNPKTADEHFEVGVFDDNQGQPDKAIVEYEAALEQKPDWAVAHFRLAQDYARRGRIEDAIAHWSKTIQYNPQMFSAYDLLASAYETRGDLKKAIETYSGLLNYPVTQMPAHYQLALWYKKLGDHQEAKEHFESYRELALKSDAEQKSDRFQMTLRELQSSSRLGTP
jgi:tetratricopeptide (TPR) repeat protein